LNQKISLDSARHAVAAHRQTRFMARQPILDTSQKVVAYELLFRSGWDNTFSGDSDDSTRQIVDNILVVGAQWLSFDTLAFVNCTREALVGGLLTLLPSRYIVLEILETIKPDPEVISACRELKDRGYRLALDDFLSQEGMGPLIEMADFIKVDFRASDKGTRRKIRRQIQGSSAALLAEKIEHRDEFSVAINEGYQYFQGYFFSRPIIFTRDEVPRSHLNSMGLLAAVSKVILDPGEIERVVLADAPFCFRLMSLVNSPIYGMRGYIGSVRRALSVIGENEFRKLVTVAMAGSFAKRQPHALLALSLQRARFCELLAPHLNQNSVEQYLIGLLSLLDVILQTPTSAIVDLLPLRPAVRSALLGERNAEAVPLSIAKCYETGDWDRSTASDELMNLGPELLNNICFDATDWADRTLSTDAGPKK
jgi:c-di-GMP-related signal transduction protein